MCKIRYLTGFSPNKSTCWAEAHLDEKKHMAMSSTLHSNDNTRLTPFYYKSNDAEDQSLST